MYWTMLVQYPHRVLFKTHVSYFIPELEFGRFSGLIVQSTLCYLSLAQVNLLLLLFIVILLLFQEFLHTYMYMYIERIVIRGSVWVCAVLMFRTEFINCGKHRKHSTNAS